MREIKFRAWDRSAKRMYHVADMSFGSEGCLIVRTTDGNVFTGLKNAKEYELMQYTGLKDKNGKESYEHDIIKVYIHNGLYPDEWIEEIVFEKGRFGIRYGDLYKEFYPLAAFFKSTKKEYIPNVGEVTIESEPMFEIIGNRWDNPELLKEGSV